MEDIAATVILKSLVSGGVAGMCAKTAVAPLDRMKILLQAHSRHYSHLGVFSGLKGIVEKERFIALYKGNGAQMVRIFPYAALQFTSFEMYKNLFGAEKSGAGRFAAGSCAGVTAVTFTYPLDTIRARLAFQVHGEHVYTGIYHCATHICKQEGGIRALYRGFLPTICGMIPYAGLSFYCFESFKYICMKHFPDWTCKTHVLNTGGLVLLIPYKLLCGGIAGAVAQTVSYPLDVTRRRMQLAMMNESTRKFGMGMVPTLKMIYQENGVMHGLYRGMSINYLRAIPMVAVSFSTYELVKQMLHLDTGIAIKTG